MNLKNRTVLAVACFALLAGCGDGYNAFTASAMTNDQIIAEKEKCEKAGMDYVLGGIAAPAVITKVTCKQHSEAR